MLRLSYKIVDHSKNLVLYQKPIRQVIVKNYSSQSHNGESSNFWKRILQSLQKAMTKHPILVNSAIYGTLYMSAEFSQQTITRKWMKSGDLKEPYDWKILQNYAVFGFVIFPQIFYNWYKWLDKKFIGTSVKVICKKLLLDQFVLTPPLLVTFFVGMSILEGKTNLGTECREKLLPTFATSCVFWLPAQTINFKFVPNQFRIVYIATCAFVWINILCYIKRNSFGPKSKQQITKKFNKNPNEDITNPKQMVATEKT